MTKIKLLRKTSQAEVLDYIAERMNASPLRVALLYPTMKQGVAALAELKKRITVPAYKQNKQVIQWSFELENHSVAFGHALSTNVTCGMSFDLIFIDRLAEVNYSVAEQFFQSIYPTVASNNVEVIIRRGTSYFEYLEDIYGIEDEKGPAIADRA